MEGIIHIAGAMPRIGTTTAAIQLVAFLKRYGYNAAYVEANGQDYLWGCRSMYEDCKETEPGKLEVCGIESYRKEKLQELTEGGTHYDYLVCDFGNVMEDGFDREQFFNCSASILVGGMKANEVFACEELLRDKAYDRSVWIFNFIRRKDRDEILGLMDDKGKFTSFLPFLPDPFEPADTGTEDADECFKKVMSAVKYRSSGR